jgi:predicted metal-dependent phosphotriesterase family hydrolase
MREVQTVCGPLASDALGRVQAHEHLVHSLFDSSEPRSAEANGRWIGRTVDLLGEFKTAGGTSIVDLTNIGMGRDPLSLRAISQRTGVNIICATGFYFGERIPAWVHDESVDALADLFVRDLSEGIDHTGIRAGVMGELGTSRGEIWPVEANVLRAAVRAQHQTGAAIMTHASYGTMALEQLDILESEGADLGRVAIGHCDVYMPPETVIEVARRGAFVVFDTIGKEQWEDHGGTVYTRPDQDRLEVILEVLDAGLSERAMLASDIVPPPVDGPRAKQPPHYGTPGYGYLLSEFVPRLRVAGVTPEVLTQMTVANPARLFGG